MSATITPTNLTASPTLAAEGDEIVFTWQWDPTPLDEDEAVTNKRQYLFECIDPQDGQVISTTSSAADLINPSIKFSFRGCPVDPYYLEYRVYARQWLNGGSGGALLGGPSNSARVYDQRGAIPFPAGGRLEQLESRDAKPVFPLTVTEGVFRQSDGKSLEQILANMELGVTGPAGQAGPGVPAGGAAGQFLAKKSDADYDSQWVDAPQGGGSSSAGVESFNGRTGAVTPQSGDYTAAQVGAVPTSRKINGLALTGDITLITCGTSDLTGGSSPLAAGTLYGVYEG